MKKSFLYSIPVVLGILVGAYFSISQAGSDGVSKTPADKLSCSKQARRIAKIEDKMEKRKFIKNCVEKREAKEKAEAIAKEKAKALAEEKENMQ